MSDSGFLEGVRVIELADELGEYCGRLLAGLGADVVKVEPPAGEVTREYGPFLDDEPDPNRSLHFWHYNLGKRSVTLDLDGDEGRRRFTSLVLRADVLLDTRPLGYLGERGFNFEALRSLNPRLVYARISPFGDDGPWANFKGSDLIHLALGGVMMNCGYSADPSGHYDTPPIAPQMWQAYHIAGEMTAMACLAALNYRVESGVGQSITVPVHQAVAQNTELDVPNWNFLRMRHHRQTAQHSRPTPWPSAISITKDGRWILPYRTYLPGFVNTWDATLRMLEGFGMAENLPSIVHEKAQPDDAAQERLAAATDRLIGRTKFERDVWKAAQREGLPWSPIRRPEENIDEEHWSLRDTFFEVEHPELNRSFVYVGAKWYAPEVPWRRGPRPPLLGEHTDEVLSDDGERSTDVGEAAAPPAASDGHASQLSPHRKPFALSGVRVVDLSWLLASGGAGRFFTSLGAEVIRVEHRTRVDGMRIRNAITPLGGRKARAEATEPLEPEITDSLNRSGSFSEINAGKRSFTLNLKHEKARELLSDLIRDADIVIEGFSPGTMERLGFGYDQLVKLNPSIIYVAQSGMGQKGTYGQLRSYGPTAQAFSGMTEMSGLPEPYPPAGIGYSYLDWFGAYNMAIAMMAALHRKRITGKGCYIDSSQVETGIYLTGSAVLNFSANGERWRRYGNASPYKLASPHGVYRAKGEDRWIAISCFDDHAWKALAEALGHSDWLGIERFDSLENRVAHADELDELVGEATSNSDAFDLMYRLQDAGVPAGVCQTAEDRCESDPQLRHLNWLVELDQAEIGRWPVRDIPVQYSETPVYMGGVLDRAGPNYGQDNRYVLETILGLSDDQIAELQELGVF